MTADDEPRVNGQTFTQYCEDIDAVIADAKAAGVKGKPITKHHMTHGRFNGKTSVTYAELDNLELYDFAKQRFGRS